MKFNIVFALSDKKEVLPCREKALEKKGPFAPKSLKKDVHERRIGKESEKDFIAEGIDGGGGGGKMGRKS